MKNQARDEIAHITIYSRRAQNAGEKMLLRITAIRIIHDGFWGTLPNVDVPGELLTSARIELNKEQRIAKITGLDSKLVMKGRSMAMDMNRLNGEWYIAREMPCHAATNEDGEYIGSWLIGSNRVYLGRGGSDDFLYIKTE